MPVNEAHRLYLSEMRMLARDDEGREILVGLTFDETEWYFAYIEERFGDDDHIPDRKAGERYLQLHDKHERVRLSILMAEIEARTSTKN